MIKSIWFAHLISFPFKWIDKYFSFLFNDIAFSTFFCWAYGVSQKSLCIRNMKKGPLQNINLWLPLYYLKWSWRKFYTCFLGILWRWLIKVIRTWHAYEASEKGKVSGNRRISRRLIFGSLTNNFSFMLNEFPFRTLPPAKDKWTS